MACKACGGDQRRNGFSAGGKYRRLMCKLCRKTEYIPVEERKVFTLQEVIERARAGGLKIWVDGKLFEVNGRE